VNFASPKRRSPAVAGLLFKNLSKKTLGAKLKKILKAFLFQASGSQNILIESRFSIYLYGIWITAPIQFYPKEKTSLFQ
jgi:hypothetical protein